MALLNLLCIICEKLTLSMFGLPHAPKMYFKKLDIMTKEQYRTILSESLSPYSQVHCVSYVPLGSYDQNIIFLNGQYLKVEKTRVISSKF